jgi:hypothetical protein
MRPRVTFRRLPIVTAFAVAALLFTAAPAGAAVWTLSAADKAFPTTRPSARTSISISAAGNEFEGAQIAVKSVLATHHVTIDWEAGSDPLLTGNSSLFEVGYVRITTPTTATGAKPGLYPDPLLPRNFGQTRSEPGRTTAFYVLFHVPLGTPAGTYSGVLDVTDEGVVTPVPVHVHVWGFGWTRLSLHTGFGANQNAIRDSLHGAIPWSSTNRDLIMAKTYQMWVDHGLSPGALDPPPGVNTISGHITNTGAWTSMLAPYLDSSGLALPDFRLPWFHYFPWRIDTFDAHRSAVITYLTDLCAAIKAQGWQRQGYAYIVDETVSTSEERRAEKLAGWLHGASAKSGFRARFLLTDDPRPRAIGVHPANGFLFNDVDIWGVRYFYFFDRLSAIRAQQSAGKAVWWYPYANALAKYIPTFVIDKSTADERIMGWLSFQWNVNGLMYYGTNRWQSATPGGGYRDPYTNPISLKLPNEVANGDASLVYPGYEPSLGLNDPYAAPVSSLRFEALRDGLEEYQYLKLAAKTGAGVPGTSAADGSTFARKIAAVAADYRYGVFSGPYYNYPSYTKSSSLLQAARDRLGNRIERCSLGLAPVVAAGHVTNAVTGKPVYLAKVTDGVQTVLTAKDGSFALRNLLPSSTLTITQPRYVGTRLTFREGDAPPAVALAPRASARVLATFESSVGFAVPGGSAALSTAHASLGPRGVRIVFGSWGRTATLRVPSDVGTRTRVEFDIYNPSAANHTDPWFLTCTITDSHGRHVSQQLLLRGTAWTHAALTLGGGIDRHHLSTLTLSCTYGHRPTIYIDTLIAR